MTSGLSGPPRNFDLDPFQVEAIDHLNAGRSVVVAAPTGSGKTYVAEHALAAARNNGRRGLYTTPIKALSNQKFRDLRGWLGSDNVGLLTGDNSINGDATAVVMTTEVLRNMLYAEPQRLATTDVVVMDEVHYLQDNFRGPVWEEVIIHLPSHIQIVALSATVSNADELAAWISDVHGACVAVTEKTRPVQLQNNYFVGEKGSGRSHVIETLQKKRANPSGRRFDSAPNRRQGGDRRKGPPQKRPWRTPRRHEVIEELDRRGLLPAITFIFSRAGCEDAVSQLRSSGVSLTDSDTAAKIAEVVENRTAHLSDNDRRALGYAGWLAGLKAGIAAHHAGIVPLFKETVEELFTAGYLKAVFATETLALGINMPARTVVIEKLSKFTGEQHELLTASDYTQLTGRAGRRGIDDRGYAVVLWTPFTSFDEVVSLARSTTFELHSAFRPTYNMTCHLVSRYTRGQAEGLVSKSFGQFQANRAVHELEKRRDRLRGELGTDSQQQTSGDARERAAEIGAAVTKLRPGDVVDVAGTVVVLSSAWRRKEVQLKVIDRDGVVHVLDLDALPSPPVTVGHVRLPDPFNPNSSSHQHDIVGQLRGVRRRAKGKKKSANEFEESPKNPWKGSRESDARRDLRRVEAKITERRGRLNDRFSAVIGLLSELGYIENWTLTQPGTMLLSTFHELDLALVESIRGGHLDGHDAPTLAGVVSTFVYESRGKEDGPPPWYPNDAARAAVGGIVGAVREVQRLESAYGLPESRDVDPGLLGATHGWAAGGGLGDILDTEELSGGDFVRSMKQVIDILSQLANVAPLSQTRATARQALAQVQRGIVDAPVDFGPETEAGESSESAPSPNS
ncbi:MAG: ATP-dependent RNA helicase HelY [Verrucomicrobiales bacterium]|jgi:ATP-dependent RNA helicase HelY